MPSRACKVVAERVRLLRAQLDLRQIDVCKKAGLHAMALSNIERAGGREPRLDTLVSIAKALGTSTDFLLGLTDNPAGKEISNALTARYTGMTAVNQAITRKMMEVLSNADR